MRQLEHLSYSGLKLWEESREAFYLHYLADNSVERPPQSRPMAAGSAFDAYVKTYLSRRLGIPADLDAAFEEEVEPQHRDFGREAGRYLLKAYIRSGMCERLLDRLWIEEVRFQGKVVADVDGMKLKGYLDLEVNGGALILDWKVNGFCSAGTTSPNPGYKLCMDGWKGKQSRSHGKTHKEDRSLAESFQPWSDQLSMYALMLGQTEARGMIHQLVGKPTRVAEFEGPIEGQAGMLARLRACWDTIASGRIFDDPEKIARLEITAAQMRIHNHVAV